MGEPDYFNFLVSIFAHGILTKHAIRIHRSLLPNDFWEYYKEPGNMQLIKRFFDLYELLGGVVVDIEEIFEVVFVDKDRDNA